MKLPDNIFGIEKEGAYKRALDRLEKPETIVPPASRVPTSLDGVNLADYILVPQHSLYVAKQRSHFDTTWYQAHQALQKEGARMLTIREFVDILQLLQSGKVVDGLEKNLAKTEIDTMYDGITKKVDPWRAEWLDADFKVVRDVLHINYGHKSVNGKLEPTRSEQLEQCVMEEGYVDLFSANRQGLPTKKTRNQDFYYWKPLDDNNSVAGFEAGSDRAILSCGRDPQDSVAVLGVRAARVKK